MKKTIEKNETEKEIKTTYRLYFMELVFWTSVLFIIIRLYLGLSTDNEWLSLLISYGFSKTLNGKDELFKFTRIKRK